MDDDFEGRGRLGVGLKSKMGQVGFDRYLFTNSSLVGAFREYSPVRTAPSTSNYSTFVV